MEESLYHAILRATGRVEQVECDLRNVNSKIAEGDVPLFSVNTLEEYEWELAKDPNGKPEPQ